ncbi:hypothetical protein [Ruegeria sp. THAF33]|uniref:hypothetical protein n=1 Tax=Ruegeria sp. THAF33 TaxID=2587853 RepID=UPI0012698148|nr:hypothetical protein [Ruegeria sp. THAF33]
MAGLEIRKGENVEPKIFHQRDARRLVGVFGFVEPAYGELICAVSGPESYTRQREENRKGRALRLMPDAEHPGAGCQQSREAANFALTGKLARFAACSGILLLR